MDINERFKQLRERLKISQNLMAQKIGTDQASLSKIENKKLGLTVDNIQKLHTEFSINLNWLLCGSGKMKEYGSGSEESIHLNELPAEYKKQDPMAQRVIEAQDKTIKLYEEKIKRLENEVQELKHSSIKQTTEK